MSISKNTLVTVAIVTAATLAAALTATEVATVYQTRTINPYNMRVRSQFRSLIGLNCREPGFKEVATFVEKNGGGTLTATNEGDNWVFAYEPKAVGTTTAKETKTVLKDWDAVKKFLEIGVAKRQPVEKKEKPKAEERKEEVKAKAEKVLEISTDNIQGEDITDISIDDLIKFSALAKDKMTLYQNIFTPEYIDYVMKDLPESEREKYEKMPPEELQAKIMEQLIKPFAPGDQKMTYIQAATVYDSVAMLYALNHGYPLPESQNNDIIIFTLLDILERSSVGLKRSCPNLKSLYGYNVDDLIKGAKQIILLSQKSPENCNEFLELITMNIAE